MNILFTTDNNYAKYLTTTIYSILKHNHHKQNIHFYIAYHQLSKTHQTKIIQLIHQINTSHQITFIPVPMKLFNSFPKTIGHISSITYARLAISDILNKHRIEKLICLDIDTLINGDLYELWNSDLQGKTIGACFDQYIEYKQTGYKNNIGLADHHSYFNAGVLLIDMKKWLKRDILSEAIQWTNHYQHTMQYQDQDILNGLFRDDVCLLNNRFNCMPATLEMIKQQEQHSHSDKNIHYPIIIYHYCGPDKPWNDNSCLQNETYHQLTNEINDIINKKGWLKKFSAFIKNTFRI